MFSSDNESSSSKEFQGSRYSRTGSRKSSKKTCKSSQIDTVLASASNKRCYVDKHHSKSFKTYVMGILNECKHVCSEFRADMEHLKLKCYRKETLHLERANRMVSKSCNIIDKLKAALDEQELNLRQFHTSWSKRYEAQNNNNKKLSKEDDKKSLQSNNETTDKEEPSENRSIITDVKGNKKNIVSDCDSDTIFSDNKSKKTFKLKCSDDLSDDLLQAKCFDTSSSDEELITNTSTAGKGPDCPNRISPILDNSRQVKAISTSPNAEALKESTECIKKSNTMNVAIPKLTPHSNNETLINPKERNDRTVILEEVKFINADISFCDDKDKIGTSLKNSFVNSLDSMLDAMNCATEENCIDKRSDTSTVYNSNEKNTLVDNSVADIWNITKMQKFLVNDTTEKERPEKENNSQDDTSINQNNLIEAPKPIQTKNTIISNDDSTHKDVTNVDEIKQSNAIKLSAVIQENILKTKECASKFALELAADLSQSQRAVSQSSLECNTSHKNKKMHADSYVSDSSCSTIELSKGKEKKMCGKESKSKCTKIGNFDTLNPSKEKILLHTSDDEEAAKKALLDSNSDDSMIASTCPFSEIKNNNKGSAKVLSDDNTRNLQAKQELLESSGSDTSNSDQGLNNRITDIIHANTKETFVKQKSNSESDDSVDSRVKRRKLKLHKNVYYMHDKRLRAQCRVLLVNLNKEILQRYTAALEMSRLYQEDKALNRLVNLDALECKHKKYVTNSEITRENNISPRATCKRKVQLEQDSLLDHLKKVENGEIFKNIDVILDTDESTSPITMTTPLLSNEDLASEADRVAKNILLHSSDSNTDEDIQSNDKSDSKSIEATIPKEIPKNSGKNKKQQSSKESDEEQASQKSKWKKNKLLTVKFSDSDSDQEKQKWIMSHERQKEKNNTDDSDSAENICKIKRKRPRRILNSDSDLKITGSDSSTVSSFLREEKSLSDADKTRKEKTKRKTRKRGIHKSSDTDSSSSDKKTKLRRKRIKKMASDSDNESDAQMNSQGTPSKSGRKNIRKVLKDKQVADDTKQAAKEEEERVQRIAERQKVYNEMYEARLAGEEKVQNLVLDFDPNTKAELITVHKSLVKRLKPHQAEGIKFMWDACFESIERLKTTKGSGCIIAHCMGLGKTLQVITLTHTLLNYEITNVKTVMVVCPLSTVLNWVHEFEMWLKDVDDADIEIYELTRLKKNNERKYQLQSWQRTGGVLIIGYDMFRNLTGPNTKMRKGMKDSILECLVDPGPDLIVCDEGHLLKNEDTALSKCMKRVKTLRRIVLTGTPLQNNLREYHCMVQFVKPNLLGTRKEFLNRFVNPITNGQFDDSTEYDVKLMKKRAHVLHKMLEGSVQRFDYSVLTPFLPPKQEYVIFVRLTDVQIKMYQFYLDNFARRHVGVGGSLFADFQALQRIWTHPRVLQLNAEKLEKTNEKKLASSDSEGSLKDFINDDSLSDSSQTSNTNDSDIQCVQDSNEMSNLSKPNTRATNAVSDEVEVVLEETNEDKLWWSQFVQPEHFTDMRISAKLMLLFAILKESEQIGDKILVFSQSLYSLTLIENFLEYIDNETQKDSTPDFLEGHSGSWSLGLDYFRLDGQTSAENRKIWCNIFNKPSNNRARLFLISTRAGGLGINLTAANRVIIFDASWNPSHDVQSIFRIYRFGQRKPCYVYRFLASGTMEEKIYNRQVTKLSLSCRVVDEQQIERHYSNNDLTELYKFEAYANENRPTLNLPKDRLLANIFLKYKEFVENYHEHDSLLENKAEEELDEEERKQAWLEYEQEKHTGFVQQTPMITGHQPNILMNPFNVITNIDQANMGPQTPMHNDYKNLEQLIRKDYPHATEEQQKIITARALTDMYNYWEKQAMLRSSKYFVPTPRLPMLNVTTNVKPYQYYPVQNQLPSNPYLLKLLQQQQPQPQQQQQQHGNTQVNHSALNAKRPNMFGSSMVPTHSEEHDVVEVPISKTTLPPVAGIQNPTPSTSKNQEE